MSDLDLLPLRHKYGSNALILSLGTYSIKSGYSAESVTSLIETPPFVLATDRTKVGRNAVARNRIRSDSDLVCPLTNSMITDWSMMEHIFSHIFYSSHNVDLKETPILVTEPVLTPQESRERLSRIFFETFHAPAYYVASEALFQLHHFGRNTGVVIDFGHSQVKVSVVFKGFSLPHCCHTSPIGSKTLEDLLFRSFAKQGVTATQQIRDAIPKIKQDLCFLKLKHSKSVTRSKHAKNSKFSESSLSLPVVSLKQPSDDYIEITLSDYGVSNSDNNPKVLYLKDELYNVPEAVFSPTLCGYGEECALGQLVMLAKVDYEKFRVEKERNNNANYAGLDALELFKHFAIVGGGSRLSNFDARVREDLSLRLLEYEQTVENSKFTKVSQLGLHFYSNSPTFINNITKNNNNEKAPDLTEDELQELFDNKGKESFHGACEYAKRLRNERWVSDVHYEQEGPTIVSRACPI